ncbi:bile acid:sodium symporter [Litoribacter ruber]|uniref:Bile acid:sodium symporter n=1 Tax=Litoribacter ruber TaxID=702568 RepID=A0AAP2G570_9BACT|nr:MULTISPECIES: bile acid:sodium symporter family protein [Litoribacter]MBS9525230.1 bile acid:sodium symporter [Litoribacter alkaliphilus]MBT0811715.1 bile acid:sodium symporter [Litoribacter ruber]
MKKIKIDTFVLAIIAVVIIAYLFPEWGSQGSQVPLDMVASIGISLIFFFYGLKLSPERIKTGLKNWHLHILIQSATFLVFPLIIIAFQPFLERLFDHKIWLAFLFLAALPSTVSSSVVMVSMAKGNIPAAIFNASISGLIGIAITPLWVGLFLNQTSSDFNLQGIYIKLLTEILFPVVLGLGLQRYFGGYVLSYSRQLALFDKSIILIIIYKSFAESFEEKVFTSVVVMDLVGITFTVVLLFYFVYLLIGLLSKKLKFSIEDRITAQFCGTKKSLVHGTVFSKILFKHSAAIGIILLPLMLFHAIQIFIISIIASSMGKREVDGRPKPVIP